ncbi:MAG: hypothetical protein M1829_000105 [Trizodia sp. TS-e1964]|nr:MAG: hypothetical protein M1829_000105 [Trizodia sp. TS-e1964]
MADKKASAYGQAASDTSFRKTWDRTEYAAKALSRETKEREEGKARYDAKLSGKKYFPPPRSGAASVAEDTFTESRRERLDLSANVGKVVLVPAGAAVGKRGHGAGTWCEACDLTFKDSISWTDHVNSMQHLRAIGQDGKVRVASLAEVLERLEYLRERKAERERGETVVLSERLAARTADMEGEREARRVKRRERRRKGETTRVVKAEEEGEMDAEQAEIARVMGLRGFGAVSV